MGSGATLAVRRDDVGHLLRRQHGPLIQYTKVRLEVTLGDDRDEASARARLDFLDPQGVVLRTVTGAGSFVRIPFEPLE
jgi:hypothetical protein